MLRVRWLTAAFDDAYDVIRTFLFSPAIELMLRIAPPPAVSMWGAHSWLRRKSEKTLSWYAQTNVVERHVEGLGPAAAGVVDEDRDLPEGLDGGLHERLAGGLVGDVAGQGDRLPARVADPFRDGLGRLVPSGR